MSMTFLGSMVLFSSFAVLVKFEGRLWDRYKDHGMCLQNKAMQAAQEHRVVLIQGTPGTGKSATLAALTAAHATTGRVSGHISSIQTHQSWMVLEEGACFGPTSKKWPGSRYSDRLIARSTMRQAACSINTLSDASTYLSYPWQGSPVLQSQKLHDVERMWHTPLCWLWEGSIKSEVHPIWRWWQWLPKRRQWTLWLWKLHRLSARASRSTECTAPTMAMQIRQRSICRQSMRYVSCSCFCTYRLCWILIPFFHIANRRQSNPI